jgi:hypothetical protein
MHCHPDWSLEVEDREDHAMTIMTRIKPLYENWSED